MSEVCLPCFHRLFGGLVLDIKRKAPWYWSDYRDALSLQCLASFLFLYCACMSPVITFGGLLGEATEGRIVRTFNHFYGSQTRLKVLCCQPSPLKGKAPGLGPRRLNPFHWITVVFWVHTVQQHSFPFRIDSLPLKYQFQWLMAQLNYLVLKGWKMIHQCHLTFEVTQWRLVVWMVSLCFLCIFPYTEWSHWRTGLS